MEQFRKNHPLAAEKMKDRFKERARQRGDGTCRERLERLLERVQRIEDRLERLLANQGRGPGWNPARKPL